MPGSFYQSSSCVRSRQRAPHSSFLYPVPFATTQASIPGATVVLSSGGSQVSTVTTDEGGSYRFPALMAGSFELTFSMRGFETISRTVTLTSDTPAIDVVMSVGRVSTTLTVTASGGKATATRLPVANDDVPAQVSSIPQELLRQQGFNTVARRCRTRLVSRRSVGTERTSNTRFAGSAIPIATRSTSCLLDGMRMGGNRYGTQTNNIQSVEVLKGPSSVLYGRGAVGGTINIVRKKPQAVRAYDFSYRGGRFNTHQIAGGATGAVGGSETFLYRLDSVSNTATAGVMQERTGSTVSRTDLGDDRHGAADRAPDIQSRSLRR